MDMIIDLDTVRFVNLPLIRGNVGCRTVPPSSFVGRAQCFQGAMSLGQKFGKHDLSITMTSNPRCNEIRNGLLPR